jgi:hypothetical protein
MGTAPRQKRKQISPRSCPLSRQATMSLDANLTVAQLLDQ